MPLTQPLDWLTQLVSQYGLGWGLVAAFVGGLFLNLTPCVYPMIPVTLAFFSQQAKGKGRHIVALAACYVSGLSLTYAILGLVAARTGTLFGSWLQQPLVLTSMALLVVGLAMSLFGLYELRLPQFLTRRLGAAGTGPWGAFVMGMVLGVVAAPCVGPFVLGLLLVVSQLANPAAGFLLLFALGLGMGLPCVLLGVAAHRVSHLPKSGTWLVWTKHLLGCILLGIALFFLSPVLPSAVAGLFAAALLFGSGIYLGWLARVERQSVRFVGLRRIVGAALVLGAVALAWPRPPAGPSVAWQPYTEQALAQAAVAGRPVVVDVYADWCLPCVELDHVTFRHPEVIQALTSVLPLRVDATHAVSPEAQAFFERFEIYGLPVVLFFNSQGREQRALRLTGFAPPEEFLARLRKVEDAQ